MPKRTQPAEPKPKSADPAVGGIAAAEPSPASGEQVNFFERLQQFTADEWRGLKLYVYRLWPVIDRKETEHFLAKISQPCDEDYLLSTFGTGKYYLRLNDSRGKTVVSHALSVYNQDHPPRVNPDEVVASDPQNERYFKAWAKPNAEPSSSGTRDAAAVADIARVAIANANAGASRPVLDPQVLTLWEKASTERDTLAQKLAEMAQRQPTPSAMEPIVMFRELLQTMQQLQKPAPAPKSAVDGVKEIAELIATVRGLMPAPTPAESSPSIWPMLLQVAGPVLGQIVQALAARNVAPPMAAPAQPLDPSAPGLAGPGTPPAADPLLQFMPPGTEAFIQVAKDAIEAMERGISGDDFAHALVCRNRAGEEVYGQLFTLGKEGILGAFSAFPGLAEQLAPKRQAIEEWLDSFISYGKDNDDSEIKDSQSRAA